DLDGPELGLAAGLAHGWLLDAMVDGVPDDVQHRLVEDLDHVAIDDGRLLFDDDVNALGETAAEVARDPWIAIEYRADRNEPEVTHRVLQRRGDRGLRARVIADRRLSPLDARPDCR